ncbi:MAG TPA: M60 family metallopeptidase, partial [Polyangiales bacterium]
MTLRTVSITCWGALLLIALAQACTEAGPADVEEEWVPAPDRPTPRVDASATTDAGHDDADQDASGSADAGGTMTVGDADSADAPSRGDARPGDAAASDGAVDGSAADAALPSDAAAADAAAADPDPCTRGPWSCVPIAPDASYGTRTLTVPAAQNWVNTGLFLKKGQRATLSAQGSWSVGDDVGDAIDHGSCRIGDMVVRSGLHYKDTALTCVNATTTFTASRDGIVFVGALTGNDLGETYESRRNASGQRMVTITSDGASVPTVQGASAAKYPFANVKSGWVEVWGEHVILTLPVSTASQDAATLGAATKRLDAIYELHRTLRDAVPQQGQRLRFFPDGTQPGYMLAGNPIRMALELVEGNGSDRISRAGEAGASNWGFAHEMGHDFTFVGGFWSYQEKTLESWPNLFSLHAFEALGLAQHEQAAKCSSSSTGSYGSAAWDAWNGLCFLLQPKLTHGWNFYKTFFRGINADKTMPWKGDWDKTCWFFNHDRFEAAAGGADMTALFTKWGVP